MMTATNNTLCNNRTNSRISTDNPVFLSQGCNDMITSNMSQTPMDIANQENCNVVLALKNSRIFNTVG